MIRKIVLVPLRFLDYLLDRIIAVAGTVIFVQMPLFIVQYKQRLGGHVDELARVIIQYNEAAKESGKTIDMYIDMHIKSNVSDFVKTGEIIQRNIDRYADLSNALKELSTSIGFNKFIVFIKNIDFSIAKSTLINFTPGVPLSSEGAVYACIGLIIGIALYFFTKKAFYTLIKRVFDKKKNNLSVTNNEDVS